MPKFDSRWNTSSGKDRPPEPYNKAEGARLVAKVMRRAETEQPVTKHEQGAKWRIEDGNHAKRFNQDAAPK